MTNIKYTKESDRNHSALEQVNSMNKPNDQRFV